MNENRDLRTIYDRLAPDYDRRRFSSAYYSRIAIAEEEFVQARIPEGARVLEVGCGTGRFTRRLVEKGRRVVAVDISEEMLGRTAERVAAFENIELVHEGFLELPRSLDGTFDAVVSMRLIPHLEDQARVVARIESLLKPGGVAIIDFWNDRSFIGMMRWLLRRPMRAVIHYRTPGEAVRIIEDAGLRVLDSFRWGYPRIGTLSLDRIGGALAGDFAYSTVFHLEKRDPGGLRD